VSQVVINENLAHQHVKTIFDNEYVTQIEKYSEYIEDKTKDWQDIQQQLLDIENFIISKELPISSKAVSILKIGIIECAQNVRSQLAAAACSLISTIAQFYAREFTPYTLEFVQSLLKIVPVSVSIRSNAADEAMKSIVRYVYPKHYIQPIIAAVQEKTNNTLRKKSIHYIKILLECHSIENLNPAIQSIANALPNLLMDAIPEVRSTSRTILSLVEQNFPELGQQIVESSTNSKVKEKENTKGGKKITRVSFSERITNEYEEEISYNDNKYDTPPKRKSNTGHRKRLSVAGNGRDRIKKLSLDNNEEVELKKNSISKNSRN